MTKKRIPPIYHSPMMPLNGRRFIGIMGFIFLLSLISANAVYVPVIEENFVSNASMRSNGWKDGTFAWTGVNNVTSDGYAYVTTNSGSLYNGFLDSNLSKSRSFYILTEQRNIIATSLMYNMIGFTNCLNCSNAVRDGVFTSMSENDGGTLQHRTYADATYCTVNDTSYKNDGAVVYNRTIVYNISYTVFNETNGLITVSSNISTAGYNYTVSYSCKNLSNMTFFAFYRETGSQLNYIRIYSNVSDFIPNITNVIINSPFNNSFIHSPLTVNHKFIGNEYTPTANCTLFINDTLYNSTVIANNNTNTNLSINLTDGNYSFYVNCFYSTTSYNSSLYTILIDNINPSVTVLSPLNHSIIDKRLNLTGYASNTNLDIVNVTIRNDTTLYYSFYEENITASIKVFTNDSINTTLWSDGLYNIFISIKDSANNTIFYQSDFNITSCFPDWVCVGYLPCNISDLTLCSNVSDANFCEDETYTGDFLEYGNFSCDYCVPILYNLSPAVCVASIRNYSVQNVNFATCCNITNLSSDCVYNGYNMKDFNGLVAFYENCQMPPQEIDFGFDVVLIIIIIICIVLVWLGITTSFSVFALLGGLGLVFCGGFIVEVPAIKIFLILIGIVTILIWAMLMYNEA